jgi:hypothetical protein
VQFEKHDEKKDFYISGDCDRSDRPALKTTWLNACPLSIRTNRFAVITAKSILYHLKVNWGNKVGIYNDANSAFSESDHFQKSGSGISQVMTAVK